MIKLREEDGARMTNGESKHDMIGMERSEQAANR